MDGIDLIKNHRLLDVIFSFIFLGLGIIYPIGDVCHSENSEGIPLESQSNLEDKTPTSVHNLDQTKIYAPITTPELNPETNTETNTAKPDSRSSTASAPTSSNAIRRIKFGTVNISISSAEFLVEAGELDYKSNCSAENAEIYLVLNPFTDHYPLAEEKIGDFLKIYSIPADSTNANKSEKFPDKEQLGACSGVSLKLDQLQRFRFFTKSPATLGFLFRFKAKEVSAPANAELLVVDTKTSQYANLSLKDGLMPKWIERDSFPPSYAAVAWSQITLDSSPFARALRETSVYSWSNNAYQENQSLSDKLYLEKLADVRLSWETFENIEQWSKNSTDMDLETAQTDNDDKSSAVSSINAVVNFVYYSAKLKRLAELGFLFDHIPKTLRQQLKQLPTQPVTGRITRDEVTKIFKKHIADSCPNKSKEVLQYMGDICAVAEASASVDKYKLVENLALRNVSEMGCSSTVEMIASLLARSGLREDQSSSIGNEHNWQKPQFVDLDMALRAACRGKYRSFVENIEAKHQ